MSRSVAHADVAELSGALEAEVKEEKDFHLVIVSTNKVLSTAQFKQMFYSRGDDFFQIANSYECPDSGPSIRSSVWGIDCYDPHGPAPPNGFPNAFGLVEMGKVNNIGRLGDSGATGYSTQKQICYNFNKLGGRDNDPAGVAWAYSYVHDGARNFYAQHEVMGFLEQDTCVKRDRWTSCSRLSIEDQLYSLAFASETDQDLCLKVTCARRWSEVEDALAESCTAANTTIEVGAGSPSWTSQPTTPGEPLTRAIETTRIGDALIQPGTGPFQGYVWAGPAPLTSFTYAGNGTHVGNQVIHFSGTQANPLPTLPTTKCVFTVPNYGSGGLVHGNFYSVHVAFHPTVGTPTPQTATEPLFRVAVTGASWPIPTGSYILPPTPGLSVAAMFGPDGVPTQQQTNSFEVTSVNSDLVVTIIPSFATHRGEFIITLKQAPPPFVDLYINVRVTNGHPESLDTIIRVRFTVAYTLHEPSSLWTWNTRSSKAAAGVIQSGVVGDAPEGGKEQAEDTSVVA